MLPSKGIRALSKQVVVAVVKTEDPRCAEMRKEFGIPYLNSWVVVLDAKGETLASWIGDVAGGGCNKRSVDKFPANLVKLIRSSLKRSETVEELERRWKCNQRDIQVFESLTSRLQEMDAYSRLRKLCQDAASNPALPKQRRDELRLRAFIARAEESSTLIARTRFVQDGEKLLVELASHPKASDLVDVLFSSGYARAFDVPTRSARAMARLKKASRRAADAGQLRERIHQLSEIREKWIEQTRKFLQESKDPSTKSFFAATLGDARAAIKLSSRPPYSEDPEYRRWFREAKAKIERERKIVLSR